LRDRLLEGVALNDRPLFIAVLQRLLQRHAVALNAQVQLVSILEIDVTDGSLFAITEALALALPDRQRLALLLPLPVVVNRPDR
jgi:hypothetical protein